MNNIKMNETLHNTELKSFKSFGKKVTSVKDMFPTFTGTRVMMMPFYAHDVEGSLPENLKGYTQLIRNMINAAPENVQYWEENTAYLTIDEKSLVPQQCQRKEGLHVDGMYKGTLSGAWGGSGGGWGSCGNGMLLVSNTDDLCKMWVGEFDGYPVNDGDCEHLRSQLSSQQEVSFKAGDVIWADGLCVHQSFAPIEAVKRQFVRVSLPNNSSWFEGYTENPLGIKPTGEIIKECRI
jgi:hypothetical protein